MNPKYFKELFIVKRKNVSTSWNDEPFTEVGRVRGFIQPYSGNLVVESGRETSKASHILYCKTDSDIRDGDELIDLGDTIYTILYVSPRGVSGRDDHKEAMAVQR